MTLLRNVTIAILCYAAAAVAHAQWLNYPAAGVSVPRTKDGKPILTGKAPRTADGKPDLSGVWSTDGTGAAAQVKFAVIANHAQLSAANFLIW